MKPIVLNAQTVFPDEVCTARVDVDPQSGTISAVERSRTTSPGRRLLFPGFIDMHVHAREFPRPRESDADLLAAWERACRKETFLTAGQAAINGGVTVYGAMPNDAIPPSDGESHAKKVELAAQSPCPVIVFGLLRERSEPWGELPYKLYLDAKGSHGSMSDWTEVDRVLSRFRGRHVFFHAEDPVTLEDAPKEGPRWVTRPPDAEAIAVEKILDLTSKHGIRAHICHVSTERAVRIIEDHNRASSIRVTCEVTPHHLFFSLHGDAVKAAGSVEAARPERLGSNPPLRSEHDREFLVAALKEGLIDALATDHAPHTVEDKLLGAPGMPHLDTLGGFAGWMIVRWGFSPQRIAEVLAVNPGRIMAPYLSSPHGGIRAGAAASFTELDLDRSTEVRGDVIVGRGPLETRCRWSPFEGVSLPAGVSRAVIRGIEYTF
ncbi:MAG: hypothetical protein AB1646_13535 [Thermodesulfobacteriota bacterium]